MKALLHDLFSHKIHASKGEWPEWLCFIAHVFNKHDGQEYVRKDVIDSFNESAPSHRWSPTRVNAFFRDELAAYISILGVCHMHLENGKWILRMSETAKAFLLGETPDVGAFLRMQLSVLEIPIPSGIKYHPNGTCSQVPNARDIFTSLVEKGVKISPVRLLITALKADARIKRRDIFRASVLFSELYTLANQPQIYKAESPGVGDVAGVLRSIRAGKVRSVKGENRFSLLKHLDLFDVGRGGISVRKPSGDADKKIIAGQIDAMEQVDKRFRGYDKYDPKNLSTILKEWADYYDAFKILPIRLAKSIAADISAHDNPQPLLAEEKEIAAPMRKFTSTVRPYMSGNSAIRKFPAIYADPEITNIKKERRNITHASMVEKMCVWLEDTVGAKVGDSMHIDLWAKLPDNDAYIFEVKSGGDGIMAQLRKGVSQLYEYRYRYRGKMARPHLCLVLPENLPYKWLEDYLCRDRDINLCYLHEDDPEFHPFSRRPINSALPTKHAPRI